MRATGFFARLHGVNSVMLTRSDHKAVQTTQYGQDGHTRLNNGNGSDMNSRIATSSYPLICLLKPGHGTAAGLLALTLLLAGCAGTQSVQETEPATAAPAPPPPEARAEPLSNTEWKAISILGKPAGSAVSTLAFAPDGRVVGNGGCNAYQGDVTLDGKAIEFGLLATTRMMCAPPVNGQETVFLEALGLARSWQTSGSVLELLDESSAVVVRLTQQ
jgi:heat shock protein HslJ